MPSALRTGLYIAGALLILGGLWLGPLAIYGVVLVLGLAFEQWRYKSPQRTRVDPRWQDTGERFVDPETEALIAVYYDPQTSERHYVAVGPGRGHR